MSSSCWLSITSTATPTCWTRSSPVPGRSSKPVGRKTNGRLLYPARLLGAGANRFVVDEQANVSLLPLHTVTVQVVRRRIS